MGTIKKTKGEFEKRGNMKTKIDEILQQKMDRKQFFKHVGAGVAAFVGFGMVVRALEAQQPAQRQPTRGYGASAYGGTRKAQASPSGQKLVMR